MAVRYHCRMALTSENNQPASPPGMPEHPRVLSVTSLNRLARSLLEGNFPAVLVEGEISNFSTPASGHWYLTLKDAKSQLRCAMFRNNNRRVRFRPDNGTQVIVKGRLSIYEARGDYQLIIDNMEESGDGALRRAFEELKNRLAEEGLFDETEKQPIGEGYRHVGVITSETGAAIRDILTVFRRRFPGTRITLLPVAVQGNEAARDIVGAIERANRLAQKLGLEVLLLARGGGSLEDLQAFNEETVARAIYASALPLVSGVGHEVDFTIADFVADLRAPTPSAAAELLSPNQQEFRQSLANYQQTLAGLIGRRLKQYDQQIGWLRRQLRHPGRRLQDHAQTLDLLDSRARRAVQWELQRKANKLRELQRTLLANSPWKRLSSLKSNQSLLHTRLLRAVDSRVKAKTMMLNQLIRSLNAVSPLNTLARGFSITYNENREVLRNTTDVIPGNNIITRLHDGTIESQVYVTNPDSNSHNKNE